EPSSKEGPLSHKLAEWIRFRPVLFCYEAVSLFSRIRTIHVLRAEDGSRSAQVTKLSVVKSFPFFCQFLKQRRWLPVFFAHRLLIFKHRIVDCFQSDLIGIKHWAASIDWEAVTIDPDDINIRRPGDDSFFENLSSFINHGI